MSRVWVAFKRGGRVFGLVCGCIVFFVCIFMIWRVFSTGTPKNIDKISRNERLLAAYSEQGDSLYMFKQNQDIITRAEYNSGYFSIPDYTFIPDANQLQLVFRYNNSTLKSVASDKGLDKPLAREEEHFDVSVVLYLDQTPDNSDDNEDPNSSNVKEVRCVGKIVAEEKTTLYNFYRYVFEFDNAEEAIDLKELLDSDELIAIHAQFYYNEELDYSKAPYGALLLYDPSMKKLTVGLSSADKAVLGK